MYPWDTEPQNRCIKMQHNRLHTAFSRIDPFANDELITVLEETIIPIALSPQVKNEPLRAFRVWGVALLTKKRETRCQLYQDLTG